MHHPRQYPSGHVLPQAEKDVLFAHSLYLLGSIPQIHNEKDLQGFLWHLDVHFPMDAFIFMLSELRTRNTGPQVDEAWKAVEDIYNYRPDFLDAHKSAIYPAIGNLAMKAWAKREEALGSGTSPPPFVNALRAQRQLPKSMQSDAFGSGPPRSGFTAVNAAAPEANGSPLPVISETWTATDVYSPAPVDPQMWQYWQSLLEEELPPLTDQKPLTTGDAQT